MIDTIKIAGITLEKDNSVIIEGEKLYGDNYPTTYKIRKLGVGGEIATFANFKDLVEFLHIKFKETNPL